MAIVSLFCRGARTLTFFAAGIVVFQINSCEPSQKKQPSSSPKTHEVEFKEIGRQGVNIMVVTTHYDSASLWTICQYFKEREGNVLMVSFFDKKPTGRSEDYLMSDHWWASYNYAKKTNSEVLMFTGYGRKVWGAPRKTRPVISSRM